MEYVYAILCKPWMMFADAFAILLAYHLCDMLFGMASNLYKDMRHKMQAKKSKSQGKIGF